jgi:hypothetical protein
LGHCREGGEAAAFIPVVASRRSCTAEVGVKGPGQCQAQVRSDGRPGKQVHGDTFLSSSEPEQGLKLDARCNALIRSAGLSTLWKQQGDEIWSSLGKGAANLIDELEQPLAALDPTRKAQSFGEILDDDAVVNDNEIRVARRAVDSHDAHDHQCRAYSTDSDWVL